MERCAVIGKGQLVGVQEQAGGGAAAVQGVAENRAAEAFHGDAELVGFAAVRGEGE